MVALGEGGVSWTEISPAPERSNAAMDVEDWRAFFNGGIEGGEVTEGALGVMGGDMGGGESWRNLATWTRDRNLMPVGER